MKSALVEFKVGSRVAPLGLRFWDPLSGSLVGDGLRVTAYPVADPTRRSEAIANRSKVYAFHRLPGMGQVERGEGDAAFWQNPPATRAYVVEVHDELGRFLPFELTINAPVRDPFVWTPPPSVSLPPSVPGSVPLFSAATRPPLTGVGVIRAELWDPNAATPPGFKGPGGPAAWAMLTAKIGNLSGVRGIADAQGKVVLMFPYPAPTGTGNGGLNAVPLAKQKWDVELAASYAPPAGKVPERIKLPGVLTQAAATLWEKWDDTDAAARKQLAVGTVKLAYGDELVVKSTMPAGSVLYVTKG